jgi:hypothetical protein
MENIQKIVEHIDDLKEKLTDGEYKALMDDLGLLHKKKEVYVKVIRIKSYTTIYTETIKNDDDGQCETELHTDINVFRYEVCKGECDCGECNRDPLRAVEIKNELKQEKMWFKVCEDREFLISNDFIGRHMFDMLKKSKTLSMANGTDILVYLDDNE